MYFSDEGGAQTFDTFILYYNRILECWGRRLEKTILLLDGGGSKTFKAVLYCIIEGELVEQTA